MEKPSALLIDFIHLFLQGDLPGPVLDLACGEGRNGLFLAELGLPVICCDISAERLEKVKKDADEMGVDIKVWQVDLERPGYSPLPPNEFGAILVFRYLHRPLIPAIGNALRSRGVLIYETYTVDQPKFGKPTNPDFLLKSGELKAFFNDWEVIYDFEGELSNPPRAVARIVCRKP